MSRHQLTPLLRTPFKASRQQLIELFEYVYTRELLERSGWDVARASRAAGLPRDQILRLIGKHNLCRRCHSHHGGSR